MCVCVVVVAVVVITVLGIEPRDLHMVGKGSTTEQYPQSSLFLILRQRLAKLSRLA